MSPTGGGDGTGDRLSTVLVGVDGGAFVPGGSRGGSFLNVCSFSQFSSSIPLERYLFFAYPILAISSVSLYLELLNKEKK